MATFKQYLQNRWYRGMSFDKEVAYPYQFWYGENVNIRNEKGAVMLSSAMTMIPDEEGGDFYRVRRTCQAGMGSKLDYAIRYDYRSGDVADLYLCDFKDPEAPVPAIKLVKLDGWFGGALTRIRRVYGPFMNVFRGGVFLANPSTTDSMLYYYKISGANYDPENTGEPTLQGISVSTDLIMHIKEEGYEGYLPQQITATYNYANTYFLVGVEGMLLRYEPLVDEWTSADDWMNYANWKIIRNFGEGWRITGLSQSGNYLKIYVTDGKCTQCHYAQGTFDLEDSGLVQTVEYEGYLSEDCLATDGVHDYGLFVTQHGLKLLEMDGYSSTIIRETKRLYGDDAWSSEEEDDDQYSSSRRHALFYTNYEFCESVPCRVRFANNTVFCSIPEEGVWSFTKESVGSHGWAWGGVVERGFQYIGQMEVSQNCLLCLSCVDVDDLQEWLYYGIQYMSTKNTPDDFVSEGYIIGNLYTAGCSSLFKKNVNVTLVTGKNRKDIQSNPNIKLYYRYDREGQMWDNVPGYIKPNWQSGIVPPKPGEGHWNLIKSIDIVDIYDMAFITTTPMFNKPRNVLEYAVKLSSNNQGHLTPILYEHNLIYEDSMRKYR